LSFPPTPSSALRQCTVFQSSTTFHPKFAGLSPVSTGGLKSPECLFVEHSFHAATSGVLDVWFSFNLSFFFFTSRASFACALSPPPVLNFSRTQRTFFFVRKRSNRVDQKSFFSPPLFISPRGISQQGFVHCLSFQDPPPVLFFFPAGLFTTVPFCFVVFFFS